MSRKSGSNDETLRQHRMTVTYPMAFIYMARPYSVIWAVGIKLEQYYRCVIVCSNNSAASAEPRSACKSSIVLDIPVDIGYRSKSSAHTATKYCQHDIAVPIGNKYSFSTNPTLTWSTENIHVGC